MTLGGVWGSLLWLADKKCPIKTILAVTQLCVGVFTWACVCLCGYMYVGGAGLIAVCRHMSVLREWV